MSNFKTKCKTLYISTSLPPWGSSRASKEAKFFEEFTIFRCLAEPGASLVIGFHPILHGTSQSFWFSQGFFWFLWVPYCSLGFLQVSQGFLWFLRVPQNFSRFLRVLRIPLGSLEFLWLLLLGFLMVLYCSLGFHRNPQGTLNFFQFQGFIGYLRICQGLLWFFRIPLISQGSLVFRASWTEWYSVLLIHSNYLIDNNS